MPTLNAVQHIVGFTHRAKRLLVNDLNAIPDDKANISPGSSARTPVNIVAECAMTNQFVTHYLTTGELKRRPLEERVAHLDAFDTKEKALAYLEESTADLIKAFEALDEEKLGEDTSEVFGRPMTRMAVAELPAVHMMYHDGQLNYIQTLYGDMEMHWG